MQQEIYTHTHSLPLYVSVSLSLLQYFAFKLQLAAAFYCLCRIAVQRSSVRQPFLFCQLGSQAVSKQTRIRFECQRKPTSQCWLVGCHRNSGFKSKVTKMQLFCNWHFDHILTPWPYGRQSVNSGDCKLPKTISIYICVYIAYIRIRNIFNPSILQTQYTECIRQREKGMRHSVDMQKCP